MRQLIFLLLVFALIGVAPIIVESDFWLNMIITILYSAVLGQAWNILGGYGGQFSFGHAAFFGTGAYTIAVLQVQLEIGPWIGFFLAGATGAAVGAFVGFSTFRYGLRGSYFALVTLAFAEVLRILSNTVEFTGAGVGLLIDLDRGVSNMQFSSKEGFFWLIWLIALAAFVTVWWLNHSRFGARLMAVRDNEDSARALGVNSFHVKMSAITVSGFFSGLAGAFYAQYYLYLDPQIAYGPSVSVESLLVPIIGGMGTLFGPLLGAGALHAISELAREWLGDIPGVSLVLYGVLLVVMVLFMPRGLAGLGAQMLGLVRRVKGRDDA